MSKSSKITRKQWQVKLLAAQQFMQAREKLYKRVLIEVAAQHPLIDGLTPNEEFTNRLLKAKELYGKYHKLGYEVEIYVPASRHREGDITDKVSLSKAGVDFLIQEGLPKEILHGEDLNEKYKGTQGVYNSADECFVAASYFKAAQFGVLISVLSPVQLTRKALNYIWQGTLPLFFTAPTQNTYHDWVQEIYETIPEVRDNDPDWQSENSKYGRLSRELRMPLE